MENGPFIDYLLKMVIFYSYVKLPEGTTFQNQLTSEATGDAALLPRAQAATGHLHIVGRVEPLSDSKRSGHVVPRCATSGAGFHQWDGMGWGWECDEISGGFLLGVFHWKIIRNRITLLMVIESY